MFVVGDRMLLYVESLLVYITLCYISNNIMYEKVLSVFSYVQKLVIVIFFRGKIKVILLYFSSCNFILISHCITVQIFFVIKVTVGLYSYHFVWNL